VVLRPDEVRAVIERVAPAARLVVRLLYGSGLRLLEALTLRIKDMDFGRGQLTIRDPKWKRDRTTMLPQSVPLGRPTTLLNTSNSGVQHVSARPD